MFLYSLPSMTPETLNNRILLFKQTVTAPARLAGGILLVHETLDQVKKPRDAWLYNPGQRRVRRAPQVAYDNPGTAADNMRTSDQLDMFNGAPDKYDWKLVGKREVYVPVQRYRLQDPKLKYKDIVTPLHINPDHLRYELHRVWVVEATLRAGERHIYKKRVFYVDEDSWQILVVDQYDNRDQLWRVSEGHAMNFYNVPAVVDRGRGAHRPAGGPLPRDGALQREPRARLQPQADRGRLHARRAARRKACARSCSPAAGAAGPAVVRRSARVGRGVRVRRAGVWRCWLGAARRRAGGRRVGRRPGERAVHGAAWPRASLLLDVAARDGLLVAVGERGHILVSQRRAARSWTQADVPTRALLTGVYMHDARLGWAVATTRSCCAPATAASTWERVHHAPENETPAARRLVRRRAHGAWPSAPTASCSPRATAATRGQPRRRSRRATTST